MLDPVVVSLYCAGSHQSPEAGPGGQGGRRGGAHSAVQGLPTPVGRGTHPHRRAGGKVRGQFLFG